MKLTQWLDDEDEKLNQVWEPFTLELGAVVRIKLHGECQIPVVTECQTLRGTLKNEGISHSNIYNNEIGVIMDICRSPDALGHYYRVFMIRSLPNTNGMYSIGSDFACTELEYVDRHLTIDEWTHTRLYYELATGQEAIKDWHIVSTDYSSAEKTGY